MCGANPSSPKAATLSSSRGAPLRAGDERPVDRLGQPPRAAAAPPATVSNHLFAIPALSLSPLCSCPGGDGDSTPPGQPQVRPLWSAGGQRGTGIAGRDARTEGRPRRSKFVVDRYGRHLTGPVSRGGGLGAPGPRRSGGGPRRRHRWADPPAGGTGRRGGRRRAGRPHAPGAGRDPARGAGVGRTGGSLLPNGCAEAVLASASWDWMELVPTLQEVGRVLVPGGVLGVMWSGPDLSSLFDQTPNLLGDLRVALDDPSVAELTAALRNPHRAEQVLVIPPRVPFDQPETAIFTLACCVYRRPADRAGRYVQLGHPDGGGRKATPLRHGPEGPPRRPGRRGWREPLTWVTAPRAGAPAGTSEESPHQEGCPKSSQFQAGPAERTQ